MLTALHGDGIASGSLAEVFTVPEGLPRASLKRILTKFALQNQRDLVAKLFEELEDGSLYRGDWRKGEIEIIRLVQIIANRFFVEAVYEVFFPPKPGKSEPAVGTYRNIVWVSGVDAGSAAIPLTTDGKVVLLKSFRHASRAWEDELARGIRLPNETAEECALREADEECGVKLTNTSEVINLGPHSPDTGLVRQVTPIILITNVTFDENATNRDVSESTMHPFAISVTDLAERIKRGTMPCGWVKGGFLGALLGGHITL